MRDKLKRRKKAQEDTAQAPAPLQPAYFQPDAESSAAQSEPETASDKRPDRAPESSQDDGQTAFAIDQPAESASADNSPQTPGGDANRRPRRRRRGGRGRKRPAQTSPAAAAATVPSPSSPAAPSAPAAIPQRTKGVVVLAIGLPGSGKSSWFKRHNISPLSSDMLRLLLFDDATEQGFQDLVFSNLRSMLKARLLARRPMNYVDATNLTPHDRHSWIKLAKDFGYEVQAVFFDVPLDVCLDRNHRRQRVVSDDVMRQMAEKLKAPTFEEGFSKITVVRVKPQPPA